MPISTFRRVLISWCFLAILAAPICTVARERVSLNEGWRFHLGDPQWMAPQLAYASIRDWLLPSRAGLLGAYVDSPGRPAGNLGSDIACAQPGFDDSAWRRLNLPHDWAIEGPFRQELPGDTGKLPHAGSGWYRKSFHVDADAGQHRWVLEVDGAMSCPLVWLNGHFVGGWAYGYSSFQLDLSPYLKPGRENVLAIRLDNQHESSRWYPGAGLYRNVWLTKTEKIHFAQWGIKVTTPRIEPDQAWVVVEAKVNNGTLAPAEVTTATRIYALDSAGRRSPLGVSTGAGAGVKAPLGREVSLTESIRVPQPRLWSPSTPARYVAVSTLSVEGKRVDEVETTFGIRSVALDTDRGFLLNGEPVRLQGVCLHHDLGALGAAINVSAIERQIRLLQEMGCNAIRTAHNPPAPEFLDACDRLGMLVFDEAFDCWAKGKGRNDYHRYFRDWHEADLRALVRRDRNHPSVVMWSIGNEVIEQWGDDGHESWRLITRLAGLVREEDRTRPVSSAFNGGNMGFNGAQQVLDAIGYNYRVETYSKFRSVNPTVPLFGSETASTLSSRGEYFFPVSDDKLASDARTNFHVSSYDLYSEAWANPVEDEWRAADAAPGYAGEFVWTGFDYLGEPTPYNSDATNLLNLSDPIAKAKMAKQLEELGRIPVPSRSSYFGIIDLAGLPKDRYYLYQARWRPDLPMAHLLPHWTWPERVGRQTPVHVYTSGDEGELFLNGKSLGRKKKAPGSYRLRWDEVVYEPGELRVQVYKDGRPWAQATQRTAGAAASLRLSVDREVVESDGHALVYVTAEVVDANGVLVPRAAQPVTFTVKGPGDVIASDNGDPTSFESFQSSQRTTFNGKAVGIVRTRAGASGTIVVRGEAEKMVAGEIQVEARAH